jgi:UDP-3-O-[3-hydroxymyristoyl] glucosamine N-acyltransferase
MGSERLKFCLKMRADYPEQFAYIHPSVEVPEWVVIGRNVKIHAGVTIGSQGFGFEKDENGLWLHIPHIGRVIIANDVEIFEGTNVCRGTVGDTVIGKGTKIDALCHIGHNVVIGENCIITAMCMIGGCTIGNRVWVGPNSTIKEKVRIADDVFIGIGTNVVKDILEPNTVWAGNPARLFKKRTEK